MPTEWDQGILLSQPGDEPALSEEFGLLLTRLERAAGPTSVVVDFQQVSYMNSSNISQLLRLRTAVAEKGGLMRLTGLADEVWSVMLVTGLDKLFEFAPDTMTALAGIQIAREQA